MLNLSINHIDGTVDACPFDNKMHIRLRMQKGLAKSVKLVYNCDKNLWFKSRDSAQMELTQVDSELEYYNVFVPLTDTRFAYIFELECNDGIKRYFSEEGLSEQYDHNYAYMNFFQYTSQFTCDIVNVPEWVKTAVCYQIFPERFFVGKSDKNTDYITAKWGEIPTPTSFHGGDLTGVCEKLDYLEDLGVNLIYMTPIFCSPSNHKYDITDYENVDSAFGGNEALKKLVDNAHIRGIKIMLDGVFNHCSWENPIFIDAQKNGKNSKYYDWFFWNEDGTYRTFGSVKYMPKLNTGNSQVMEYFSKVAVKWMKEYNVDGWRLDVSDEISHKFLRRFREAVTEQNPDAIIIGEDWHRPARYLNGDEYDGTMNYPLTKACLDLLAFKTIDSVTFRDRLVKLYNTYNIATNYKMLNLLGTHDTDRFLSRVDGDGNRLRTAMAIMFFYPGIPCVYYADEIGTEGGYDPDCRRCFDWNKENWDIESYNLIKELMKLKKEPALSYGCFDITENGGMVTITRSCKEQTVALKINATENIKSGIAPFGFEIIK